MMIKIQKGALALLLALLLSAQSIGAFAENSETGGNNTHLIFSEDFEQESHIFTAAKAPEHIAVEEDLTRPGNRVLMFSGGVPDTLNQIDARYDFDLSSPVVVSGRVMANQAESEYWDVRIQVLVNSMAFKNAIVLSDDNHIYTDEMTYRGDYIFDGPWKEFSLVLQRKPGAENTIACTLILGTSRYPFEITSEDFSGKLSGIRLFSVDGRSNGKVYFDDIAVYRSDESFDSTVKKINSGATVSEEECKAAALVASEVPVSHVMRNHFKTIMNYAKSRGYHIENALSASVPAAEQVVAARDVSSIDLDFLYPLDAKNGCISSVTASDHSAVSAETAIKGNRVVITLNEKLQRAESYTATVSGLKDFAGNSMEACSLHFMTNFLPDFNVADGGMCDIGAKLRWSLSEGVTAEVSLQYESEPAVIIENGYEITKLGSYTLYCKAEKDSVTDEMTIHFNSHTQTVPQATEVLVSGDCKVGSVLRGSYTYADAEGDAQAASKYFWMRSESAEGPYTDIDGACGTEEKYLSYTVTAQDVDHYLKFAVIPVASSETLSEGEKTFSEAITGPFRPVVKNITIKGTARIGESLSGYYDYYDANGDEETSESILEWIDGSGKVLEKGTSLQLTSDLEGKKVAFRVTAVSTGEPAESETVTSDYVTVSKKSSGGGGGGGSHYSGSGIGSKDKTEVAPPQPSNDVEEEYFSDVKTHWAKDDINKLYEAGIIKGTRENFFEPDKVVSRAEMLVMILRTKGITPIDYRGSFRDVHEEDWFCGYIEAALTQQIISADTDFRPKDSVTREETAKLIAEILSDKVRKTVNFADKDAISQWAAEYVEVVFGSGIMTGDNEGMFRPHDSLTRGEAAAVICRAIGGNND